MRKIVNFLTLFCVCIILLTTQINAKDNWVNVRSKNFNLVGNASEKDIRGAATKLEQFREVFRQLFPKTNLNSSIPTNVVVFKSDSSFKAFKPKRADGTPNETIAGYFLPNDDTNYIAISTEGKDKDTYQTIFHEYVHYLLDTNFGISTIPLWFNEGLAEYYQTFKIKDDQVVTLGSLQPNHIYALQIYNLMPFKSLFETKTLTLRQGGGGHSNGIFYAQSWALIHYLIHGNRGANKANMRTFLGLLMNKVEPEKAFRQVFQRDYETMERELKQYLDQKRFEVNILTFDNKLTFDSEMKVLPISEAETAVYLGDLLYKLGDHENAEKYLKNALALSPDSSALNTSYGLVKMRQRKFGEAKTYLEKALAKDEKNYYVNYSYAEVLTEENIDEKGVTSKYSPEQLSLIRRLLQKAIESKPEYPESYRLLAFVNLINETDLDEGLALLKKALKYKPENQHYNLLEAKILLRQEKISEARKIAGNLSKNANSEYIRANADYLINAAERMEASKNFKKKLDEISSLSNDVKLNPSNNDAKNRLSEFIKNLLYKPQSEEKQKIVMPDKVECSGHYAYFTVRSGEQVLRFRTMSAENVRIAALTSEITPFKIGCETKFPNVPAVISFRPSDDGTDNSNGRIIALEFVPKEFSLD